MQRVPCASGIQTLLSRIDTTIKRSSDFTLNSVAPSYVK